MSLFNRKHAVSQYDETHYRAVGTCPITGKQWDLVVPKEGYDSWTKGLLIQHALPHLSSEERELLISGITQDGWVQLFPPEEE